LKPTVPSQAEDMGSTRNLLASPGLRLSSVGSFSFC